MPQDIALGQLKLLHDLPISADYEESQDGLGFHTYAKILASAALHNPGPFTIGVFGEWGTGKTSLMQMVKGLLDAQTDEKVVTVWFEAWLHEREEHPLVPLIATIVKALEPHRDTLEKLADGGKNLLTGLYALAHGFSVKVKRPDMSGLELEVGLSVENAQEAWQKLKEDPLLHQSLYAGALDRISDLRLSGKLKIVVLIDDLDRCLPEQAIKLLESIKLVLDQPGFVFILGVSRSVIEGYLEHLYEDEYGLTDFEGSSYLDKMVQLPFHIPPHSGRMEAFSDSLLRALHSSDAEDLGEILPLVGVACGNNPRATVRFVNNLLLDKAINRALLARDKKDEGMVEVPIQFFAISRALQQRWWDMWSLLVTSDQLCSEVAGWQPDQLASFASSSDHDIKQAAAMLIGDRDLQELLFSHGNTWLENGDLRNAAHQFLRAQRQETSTARQVVLCCDERDSVFTTEVAHLLAESGIRGVSIRPDTFDIQQEYLLSDTLAFVLVLGTNWRAWETKDRIRSLAVTAAQKPLYFIILAPQAEGTTLPDRIPNVLTIALHPGDVVADALAALIRSLKRLDLPRLEPQRARHLDSALDSSIKCPRCGTMLSPETHFCAECGQELSQ